MPDTSCQTPQLAIIIVSWNVRELLRRCLHAVVASLAEDSAITYTIIVVDNASSDDTPAMVRREFPQVRLLEAGANLGFAGANNLALRELGFGQPTEDRIYPHVLLLNPDTEVIGEALLLMVRYLDAHPEVVAVGPRLQYADGETQSSRRRFPRRGTFFWESTPLERWWPNNSWVRHYRCTDQRDDSEQRVGWLVGAALLVRGGAIARAGLLDARFFMYSEELEWQWRLQRFGGQGAGDEETGSEREQRMPQPPTPNSQLPTPNSLIIYLPQALIVHYEGKSSEQALAGRHLNFQRSKIRLARLLYGPRFAHTVRGFLLLGYAWELAVESAKYLLGHRRSLRRQRMGVYAAVLRSRLREAQHDTDGGGP